MSLRIAAWNTEGRLTAYGNGRRGQPEAILQGIEALTADVVVLPEAYLDVPADGVDESLRGLGYEWTDVPYDDTGREGDIRRWGRPHMRVLYRVKTSQVMVQRWGNVRGLLTLDVRDPATNQIMTVLAAHLDDRSEDLRLRQLDEIIPFIVQRERPVVMLGDFNAMWHERQGRLLASRSVRQLIARLPHDELRSIATRLADMATGTTMQRLRDEAGLIDADPRHRPTTTPKMRTLPFMPSIRLAQIDHILVSKDISVQSFRIARDGGSDHRAISAIIST